MGERWRNSTVPYGNVLTNVFATKMWSCHELDPQNIIHILGFITANFLTISVMILAALAIFQACIWLVVHIRKSLIYIQIRHIVRLFEF